jgi:SLT domain-containing protein
MIVKGSMSYDIHGRKRKKVRKTTKKVTNKWQKATKSDINSNKTTKSSKQTTYPSAKVKEYQTPEDTSYKKEISKQYTVSIAYNKGAYQVIPKKEVKDIGK